MARKTSRPMRPNPLIATLTAIVQIIELQFPKSGAGRNRRSLKRQREIPESPGLFRRCASHFVAVGCLAPIERGCFHTRNTALDLGSGLKAFGLPGRLHSAP